MKKLLSKDLKEHPGMEAFIDAVSQSYAQYDERLSKEAKSQHEIAETLKKAIVTIQHKKNGKIKIEQDLDIKKLVTDIEKQTYKVAKVTAEKDALVKNLEQQNESLNNYAHMVSHDLKSPIRNVHSLVSWVFEDAQNEFKEHHSENVQLIFKNLTKMDSLIDGILRHSTIDSIEESAKVIDLNHLMDEIQETIFVPKNISIKKSKDLPKLYTGKYRLEQLFKNLITNAIAATEDRKYGQVIIDVKEQDDGWLFSVTDNGKGIPKHLQAGIFNMFKKLENNADTTGIGLALVKKIINYYKGDIWLSSKEGMGSTFFFTIKNPHND
ncbi:ATP-binding protein [Flagellimonas sp. 389]|uniref:sensor histidine kinase n=1 Tax=Flagellimonas sp. 389 TaxID=2835862 RepID=UPI002023157B|nr:HAMP domain-containing sensor histidine kinase [Flagellimonas sp. 389]